jgi:hypothetical protein
MYRVVIKRFDHRDTRIIEKGPWHMSRDTAEDWADTLRDCGYHTEVESQLGLLGAPAEDDDNALRDALAGMA